MDIREDSYEEDKTFIQTAEAAETVELPTPHNVVLTPQGPVKVACAVHLVSDGYHTYDELYDHINALFARVCMATEYPLLAWKSLAWKCLQGIEGSVPSFLVGVEFPPHGVVARYIPMPIWERLDVQTVKNVAGSWSTKNSSNIPRLLGRPMPALSSSDSDAYGTITTPQGVIDVPCPTGKVSNGFDSFDDLYELRHALFVALCHLHADMAWKSMYHEDGTMFDGYFIAGIELPEGMVTYHLPIELWDLLDVFDVYKAPAWDGHTASDVVERLLKGLPEGECIV